MTQKIVQPNVRAPYVNEDGQPEQHLVRWMNQVQQAVIQPQMISLWPVSAGAVPSGWTIVDTVTLNAMNYNLVRLA